MEKKDKKMYALLVVVTAMIGITIYESCSADEDYDGYSSKNELFTLADEIMGRGGENGSFPWIGDTIESGHHSDSNIDLYHGFVANIDIEWQTGYTGNQILSHSSVNVTVTPNNNTTFTFLETIDEYRYEHKVFYDGVSGDWNYPNILSINIRMHDMITCYDSCGYIVNNKSQTIYFSVPRTYSFNDLNVIIATRPATPK